MITMIRLKMLFTVDGLENSVDSPIYRSADGKIHIPTPPGAILQSFWLSETYGDGDDPDRVIRCASYPWLLDKGFEDIVFDDPTVLTRTRIWCAARVAARTRKRRPRLPTRAALLELTNEVIQLAEYVTPPSGATDAFNRTVTKLIELGMRLQAEL